MKPALALFYYTNLLLFFPQKAKRVISQVGDILAKEKSQIYQKSLLSNSLNCLEACSLLIPLLICSIEGLRKRKDVYASSI